jgi:hypothetical protein
VLRRLVTEGKAKTITAALVWLCEQEDVRHGTKPTAGKRRHHPAAKR